MIPDDLIEALGGLGLCPSSVYELSPALPARKTGPVWRVECKQGVTVKARRFLRTYDAACNVELRQELGEAFAPVLARHREFVIEAWLDGRPVRRNMPCRRFHELGAILADLHGTTLKPTIRANCPTEGWLTRAARDIQILVQLGKMPRNHGQALNTTLAHLNPGTGANAIIHGDIDVDNVIQRSDGTLAVVDNEFISVGPAGFDLGCTRFRWGMTEQQWYQFGLGYRSREPSKRLIEDLERFAFWHLLGAIVCTASFARLPVQRCDAAIKDLKMLITSVHGQEA